MRVWTRFDALPRRFLRAYEYNSAQAADFSENRLENGALIYQSGGAFLSLRFRRVRMSNVCCEIMAAYNAMTLTGINVDFLKLAAEFERGGAIPAIPPGVFGSSPLSIGKCLTAYGVKFTKYTRLAEFESALKEGSVAVLSYKFKGLDPRVHGFTLRKTADGITAYNRFSNDKAPRNYDSVAEAIAGKVFLVGYVIMK
ncbi:MAG: hypothetical protein K2J77_12825 [Oscillospiraceae bacterium]|nr:hypothetical protein [Oscillospiraceae bacterium]